MLLPVYSRQDKDYSDLSPGCPYINGTSIFCVRPSVDTVYFIFITLNGNRDRFFYAL